eukprot:10403683-Heterocapsa_arctica.AAC.1
MPCAFLGPWARALPISSALKGCPRRRSCSSLGLGVSGASPSFRCNSDPRLWVRSHQARWAWSSARLQTTLRK